jgi:hypothetical protein
VQHRRLTWTLRRRVSSPGRASFHTVFERCVDGFVYCPLFGEYKPNNGAVHGLPGREKFKKANSGTERRWRHLTRHHPKFLVEALLAYDDGRGEEFARAKTAECLRKAQVDTLDAHVSSPSERFSKVKMSWVSQALQVLMLGQSFESLNSIFRADSFVELGLDARVTLNTYRLTALVMPAMERVVLKKLKAVFRPC